jgi:hypothetical protein
VELAEAFAVLRAARCPEATGDSAPATTASAAPSPEAQPSPGATILDLAKPLRLFKPTFVQRFAADPLLQPARRPVVMPNPLLRPTAIEDAARTVRFVSTFRALANLAGREPRPRCAWARSGTRSRTARRRASPCRARSDDPEPHHLVIRSEGRVLRRARGRAR